MEFFGFMAFMLLLFYSDYPNKTKKLSREVTRLKRRVKGENEMSILLGEIIGKDCEITMEDDAMSFGASAFTCTVLDVDDEWVKILLRNRKEELIEKLIRVENIESIELVN